MMMMMMIGLQDCNVTSVPSNEIIFHFVCVFQHSLPHESVIFSLYSMLLQTLVLFFSKNLQ